MFILYVLECLLVGPRAVTGGASSPMWTTGQPPTLQDHLIGVAVWAIILATTWGVVVLIRKHLRRKSQCKPEDFSAMQE